MKALSLKQPWASMIASGKKTIETRKWKTTHRGPILICASKATDKPGPGVGYSLGVALCVVDIIDCRKMVPADEAAACCAIYDRAQAWELANLRVLEEPIAISGALSIFDVAVEIHNLRFRKEPGA